MCRVWVILVITGLLFLGACAPVSDSGWTEIDRTELTVPAESAPPAISQVLVSKSFHLAPKDDEALAAYYPQASEFDSIDEYQQIPWNDYGYDCYDVFFLQADETIDVVLRSDCPIAIDTGGGGCEFEGGI